MRSLLILGCGGHGKVVYECALLAGEYCRVAFASNLDEPSPVDGVPVYPESEVSSLLASGEYGEVLVAIGDNVARRVKCEALRAEGAALATLVHPSACVSPSVEVGAGSVVLAGAVINAGAKVGAGCIVNTRAVIEHDCVLGDYAHMSPGACIGGGTRVGEGSWLCIGSVISDHVDVAGGVTLGAGSALLRDAEGPGLYVGSPARLRRKL
ncbi:acetyltransferase [Adlercreutzia sp. ZJ242]|uniref:acetyltransferase n=1 Tax=Adlercreutzia sp. ZJ242 TaxID=2709409 RepID=UPI0013EBF429|nr:acetyltransferase [Adlercreutzia sp. ZJ242]